MADTSAELLGGRYRLLGERTSFPFGAWWEAEDDQGARTIVLRMSPEVADPAGKAQAAIAACSKIDSPHLVPWADGGVDAKGQGWLAAPMFGPWSLTEHVSRGEGIPPSEAAVLLHQVARAVAAGEAAGVLHHALSSELIRLVPLTEGGYGVKIYGFGLADLMPSYKPLRKQDSYLGVPDYMSPELCAGKAAEGSSADVYAIGILMYEAVRGRPPFAPTFASASASTTLKRHIFEKPLALHVRYANAPFIKSYENICFKALAKTANRRQLTVAELERELEQLITDEMRSQVVPLSSISARNPSTSRRLRTQVLQSVVVETPSVEVAKVEPPKAEAPKAEPAKVEAPKPEPAKVEAPKPEPAKVEAPKPEPAKVEAPKPEAAKVEPTVVIAAEEPAAAVLQAAAAAAESNAAKREGTLVFAGLGPAVREMAEAARKAEEDEDEGTGEEEAEPATATPGGGQQPRKGKKKKGRKQSTGVATVSNAATTGPAPRPTTMTSATVTTSAATASTVVGMPKVELPTGESEAEPRGGAPSKEARIRKKDEQTVKSAAPTPAVAPKAKEDKPKVDEQEDWFDSADVALAKKPSRAWLFLLIAAAIVVIVVLILTLGGNDNPPAGDTTGAAAGGSRYAIKSPEPPPRLDAAATAPPTAPAADTAQPAADTLQPAAAPDVVVAPDTAAAAAPDTQPAPTNAAGTVPEPPKTEPPKTEPPKTEPPKTEPPKTTPPKTEPPKTEPPKTEPPKTEPPKTTPPKTEPPKTEPPKTEPPKTEPPKTEPGSQEEQFKAQAKHYLQLGIQAYKAENYKLAAGYFKKAQEADPSNAVAASYLKKAQEKLGQ